MGSLGWGGLWEQKENSDLGRFQMRGGMLFKKKELFQEMTEIIDLCLSCDPVTKWVFNSYSNSTFSVPFIFLLLVNCFFPIRLLSSYICSFSRECAKGFPNSDPVLSRVSSVALKTLCKTLVSQQNIISFSLALGQKKCHTDIHFNDASSIK